MPEMMRPSLLCFFLLFNALCCVHQPRPSDDVSRLLGSLAATSDEDQRTEIILELYNIDDPRVVTALDGLLSHKASKQHYYVAQYLAKRGDEKALAILNKNYFKYPVSSQQWAFSVHAFGLYKYTPAVPNLIKSLGAASLNVVDEAVWSLKQIYPGSPESFRTPEEAIAYFTKRSTSKIG